MSTTAHKIVGILLDSNDPKQFLARMQTDDEAKEFQRKTRRSMQHLQSAKHLFVASDGNLYDTRRENWHSTPPLRAGYRRMQRDINTVADLKAALRSGFEGYPGVYYCDDGAIMCEKCTRDNFRQIAYSVRNRARDGWRVVGTGYEAASPEAAREHDPDIVSYCAHCNREFGELS